MVQIAELEEQVWMLHEVTWKNVGELRYFKGEVRKTSRDYNVILEAARKKKRDQAILMMEEAD